MSTSLGVLSKISDNIYLLDYKDGLEIDVKNSVEFRNQLTELIKDKKIGIILNAMNIQGNASISSMQFFSNDVKYNKICVVQAIITNKLALKLLAKFYTEFFKKKSKVKVFSNFNEGLSWVEEQVNSELKS